MSNDPRICPVTTQNGRYFEPCLCELRLYLKWQALNVLFSQTKSTCHNFLQLGSYDIFYYIKTPRECFNASSYSYLISFPDTAGKQFQVHKIKFS